MTSVSIRVEGPDQAAEARRTAAAMARGMGLDESVSARAALVVTEAATNIWKHGGGGELLLSPLPSEPGIEILALDKGPGMGDVTRCFQDGYSTGGSAGTGLGAIRRLSVQCEVYTAPGKGTALLARVRKPSAGSRSARSEVLNIGAISVPKPGESACGDQFSVMQSPGYALALVVDGLGHGQAAADAAIAGVEAFKKTTRQEPAAILAQIHGALRATRGAAAAVARFDRATREIRFAGIGNISGVVFGDSRISHMTSLPGIVGHDNRNVREFTYAWPEGAVTLLYSDGIATHWSIHSYDGLLSHDPSVVAGVIYRDWNRGRDDATILAASEHGAP